MCLIDDCDERMTMVSERWQTARKEHQCTECRRTISSGERYRYEAGKFDGNLEVYKTCSHCMVVRDFLNKQCGGWVFRGVEEDLVEHAYLGTPVARLIVAMRRDWRFRDGSLMPVPKELSCQA